MDGLRVLVIEQNPRESERIASILEEANHAVLPATGFAEASEALLVQRFDAVLLGCPAADGMTEFTTKLRQLEKKQRSGTRAPVLSLTSDDSASCASKTGESGINGSGIDGYLPREFDPLTFSNTVHSLAQGVKQTVEPTDNAASELPVLEPEEFKAQVAHDRDLLIEIIDLFIAEYPDQLNDMRNAVLSGDYQRLGRTAHTIKGSLGSLHAPQAWAHAQQLELAAKQNQDQVCRFSLHALERDLETLQVQLLALRRASSEQ